MRNLKRVLSTLLAITMLMGLVVFGASATNFNDDKDIVYKEAVDMATALNIINGYDDGSYRPEGTITRAEMCKMICMVMNGGNQPTLGVNTTATFTDIKGHWAEAYIEYCVAEGIVAGMGDGTFQPEGNVTGTQAAKMLLVALGYRATVEEFNTASWAVKINVRATQKKLFDQIPVDPNAALSRDSAAQMIWNALNACVVEYGYELITVDGQLTSVLAAKDVMIGNTNDELSLLQQKFGSYNTYGTLTAISWNEKDKEFVYTIVTDPTSINSTTTTFKSATDYSDLFAMDVKVVAKTVGSTTTVFGIVANDSVVMATGIFDDMDFDGTNDTSFTMGDTKLNITRGTTLGGLEVIAMNQHPIEGAAALDFDDMYQFATPDDFRATNAAFDVRVIDYNGDNRADLIVFEPFSVAKVSSVTSDNVNVKDMLGSVTTTRFSKDDDVIDDDVKKDSYVMIVDDANRIYDGHEVTLLDSNEVEVDRTKGSITDVYGNDTWYVTLHKAAAEDIKTDETWELFGVKGFAFFADLVEGVGLKDIVYITAIDTGFDDRAKIYFLDGTSKTVDVEDWELADGTTWTGTGRVGSLAIYKEPSAGVKLTKIDAEANNGKLAGMDGFVRDASAGAAAGDVQITAKDGTKMGRFNFPNGASGTVTNNSFAIDADGAFFVIYNDGGKDKVKVLSGAELRSMKETSVASGTPDVSVENAAGTSGKQGALLYDEVSGVLTAKTGFVYAQAKPKAGGATDYYGYVVAASFDKDGAYLDIWNGETLLKDQFAEDYVQGTVNSGISNEIAKHSVIKYTVVNSSEIDIDVVYTAATAPYAAVTGHTNDGLSVTSNWDTTTTPGSKYYNGNTATFYYYDDDAVIIGVDTDKVAGANPDVDKADVYGDGTIADAYAASNVRYILDSGDIVCVFFDVYKDFAKDPNT